MGLLQEFLGGATAGAGDGMLIEGPVLIAATDCEQALVGALGAALLMRVDDGAMLVRLDIPASLEPARAAAEDLLVRRGLELVDADAPLATVVAIELAGLRGSAWSLWADDAERGQAVLERAAAGDLAAAVDRSVVEAQAQVDATLAALEDEFPT